MSGVNNKKRQDQELRLRSPKSPLDLEKTKTPGQAGGASPPAAVKSERTTQKPAKVDAIITPKRSYWFKISVFLIFVVIGVAGVLLYQFVFAPHRAEEQRKQEAARNSQNGANGFGGEDNSNYTGNSTQTGAPGPTWTPAPFLSTQNFTFITTNTNINNFDLDGFVNFVIAITDNPINDIKRANLSLIPEFNNSKTTVMSITVEFYSFFRGSNDFRNDINAALRDGIFQDYDVVGFGEGLQTPQSYCDSNQYGTGCATCPVCDSPLLRCDSGTLGTGQCVCAGVFVNGTYFQQYLAGYSFEQRCLYVDPTSLYSGLLAVEKAEFVVKNVTIINIGSTQETFTGAMTVQDLQFADIVQTFFRLDNPPTWPVTLNPGDSLTLSIMFAPTAPGNYSGTLLAFVDNDATAWIDDANVGVTLNVSGTVAGQFPINGMVSGTFSLYRINCGSRDAGVYNGTQFDPDNFFLQYSTVVTAPNIASVTPNPVLQTMRQFTAITVDPAIPFAHYRFPMLYAGNVRIQMYFADYASGVAGTRTFNIVINNEVRLINGSANPLDIYVCTNGNVGTLCYVEFIMPVAAKSNLDIAFVRVGTGLSQPVISAIQIWETLNLSVANYFQGLQGADVNYAEALHKLYLFFEAQKSGNFTSRLAWRRNATNMDMTLLGSPVVGGYYEAGGNYLIISFPQAWVLTNVGIGLIFRNLGHQKANNVQHGLNALRHGLDYILASKMDDQGTFILSVGNAFGMDFSYTGPPEVYYQHVARRNVWYINSTAPFRSSETLAESAAALAVGSMVFKTVDPNYSARLLAAARVFYDAATQYEGTYMAARTSSVTGFFEITRLYPSSNYFDEMAWGALWLYNATGEAAYLNLARSWYDRYQTSLGNGCGWGYSWDEKGPALHVFLRMIDNAAPAVRLAYYDAQASAYLNRWMPGRWRSVPTTPRGLSYLSSWGSTRYSANTAMLALFYSRFLTQNNLGDVLYRNGMYTWAKGQIDYILGRNGRSMMVGMGTTWPQYNLHKASYCSWLYISRRGITPGACASEFGSNRFPSIHIAYGAVIGGPMMVNGQITDFYSEARGQYQYTEPGLDFVGPLSAAIASLCEDNNVTAIYDAQLDLGYNFTLPR